MRVKKLINMESGKMERKKEEEEAERKHRGREKGKLNEETYERRVLTG